MQSILTNLVTGKIKYNVLMVGIGGVSMSNLALYLKCMGHNIVGVDTQKNKTTKNLENNKIEIIYKHNKENISRSQIVIYSYAVEYQVEVQEAQKLNIPTFSRAELLGEILKKYNKSICIAGAHGKTTTTALIYWVLKTAKVDVDLHLGGSLNTKKQQHLFSTLLNGNNVVVCEACEYKDAFLNFKPSISVVTNIAPEHLDYFKTFENVKKSFTKFILSSNKNISFSDIGICSNDNTITYGSSCGDYTIADCKMLKDGTYKFVCIKNGNVYGKFRLNLIGSHNVLNALACICVCDQLNISKKKIKKSLKTFCGVQRRFQFIDRKKFMVHDYAHHPDEINAVIKETLKFYKGKLLVVFQPHTYTRTKNLMPEFIKCFKDLTDIAIYKTYSAREKYLKSGSAKTLCEAIGDNAKYFKSKKELIKFIKHKVKQKYGVLILGAGNIVDIIDELK